MAFVDGTSISAVIPAFGRSRELRVVLERLAGSPVAEIVIVENAPSEDISTIAAESPAEVRIVRPGRNTGIGARNLGLEQARGHLVLMLDDDSYPLPGAVATLAAAFAEQPRLAVAGGLVRDVDESFKVTQKLGLGSFDWWLRAGRGAEVPPEGLPAFFFPAGACMVRRSAVLEVGGFLEHLSHHSPEIELATRLISAGWDVRYLPSADFDHMKATTGRAGAGPGLRLRIRDQLWYFWLHFPPGLAARRMAAYLLFDLIECVARRAPLAWPHGIADAWRDRELVRPYRRPLSRAVLRRAELNRGRMHARLLLRQLKRRLLRSDRRST